MRRTCSHACAPMRGHLKLALALERLHEIAASIAALKALMHRTPALAADCRLVMGCLLVEAKALVPKRHWMAWLEANVPYDTSYCRRLMQMVRGCPPAVIERIIDQGVAALLGQHRHKGLSETHREASGPPGLGLNRSASVANPESSEQV